MAMPVKLISHIFKIGIELKSMLQRFYIEAYMVVLKSIE